MKPKKKLTSKPSGANGNLRRSAWRLVASCVVGFSPSAFAQYEATAYVPSGQVFGHTTTPGDVSYAFDSGTGASAVVAFTSSPIASVSYTSTAFNPSGQIVLSGEGSMTYRFEVTAQPFSNVPIDFSGLFSSVSSPASAGYGAFTSFLVQTVNSSVSTYSTFHSYFQGDCGGPACLQFNTFNNTTYTSTQSDGSHVNGSFQGTLDMLTGANGSVIGMVQLAATAGINTWFVPGTAEAFIDPHLEIDATFLAANPGATLSITPGVGNEIPAVPEPGTYALMLLGLAAVGFSERRRGVGLLEGTRPDRS